MPKQKGKLRTENDGNDSDGSDYVVDWQVKPTPAKLTKADQFPLPKEVEKRVKKRDRGRAESSSDESDDQEGAALPTLTSAQLAAIRETIRNNKRFVLMVNNVNFSTSKEEIEQHFTQAGRVKGVRIPRGRKSGFAFVEMLDPVGFQKAFLLDGSYLDGRQISVFLSESGKKKSDARIKMLMEKNIEVRKLRKKNKRNENASAITLVPESKEIKPPAPLDKFLNKPKVKKPSRKETTKQKKQISLKAKIKHMAKMGIKP